MTNNNTLIDRALERGVQARGKVLENFRKISHKQFNWKPSPASWSIAQCLEHLVISDRSYFQVLEKIINGKYTLSFWEKYSPFSGLLGKMLIDNLQEEVKRKTKTSDKLVPAMSEKDPSFINDYLENLDTFMKYISACRQVDLNKTIITSPMLGFVTYSLKDAITFLPEHEHRHINQAIRVKEHPGFPGNN